MMSCEYLQKPLEQPSDFHFLEGTVKVLICKLSKFPFYLAFIRLFIVIGEL